jgi:HSP20 family protein
LPDDVDSDAITATFKNGLLTLNIKKRAESQRKLIKIEG